MELYVIRHAWAAERDMQRWPDDDQRPLTDEGRARFARMMKKLYRRGMAPARIAASPLVRCLETARILAAVLPRAEVVPLDALRPGGDWESLLRWSAEQGREHESIAWVGHAPEVGLWTAALIGAGGGRIHFAKGAAACVRFDGPPAPGAGELQWLVPAKLLSKKG